jgi:hypothetical protein
MFEMRALGEGSWVEGPPPPPNSLPKPIKAVEKKKKRKGEISQWRPV